MGIIKGAASRIFTKLLGEPAKGEADDVLEAVEDKGEAQTIAEGLTQPPEPRNITATAAGIEGDIKAIKVKVTGTNQAGQAITEELPAFTVNEEGTVEGSKAFASITKVEIPAHDGEGATTSVGLGDKLGLGELLDRNTVLRAFLGDVLEGTAPTVATSATALESNTVDLNSALTGEAEVRVDFYKTG